MKIHPALDNFIHDNTALDTSYLTPKLKFVIDEFMAKRLPNVPKEASLYGLLARIAKVAGFNRVSVGSSVVLNAEKVAPANFYGILFMPSGIGKDVAPDIVENYFMKDILKEYGNRIANFYAAEEKKKADDKSYELPNYPQDEFMEATMEGFLAQRIAYQEAGFGGTFLKISEFGDFIKSTNEDRQKFLIALQESWDTGKSGRKSIKGEKKSVAVEGVPSNAILHGSVSGLLEGEGNKKLLEFFNRQLARRSFVFYPNVTRDTNMDVDYGAIEKQEAELEKQAITCVEGIKTFFTEMYNGTKPYQLTNNGLFTASPAVDTLVRIYKIYLSKKAGTFAVEDEEGLSSESSGRHWKAIKLACLIAAFEHPEVKEIAITDLQCAVYISELCGNHIKKFYRAKPSSDADKLFQYLLSREDSWIATMDIREQKFVYKDNFKKWFDNNFEYAEEIAHAQGYTILSEMDGRAKRYMLKKRTPANPYAITVSQGDTNDARGVTFKATVVDFSQFHTITGADRAWSCATFKDDYRKDENAKSGIDVIALDSDGGWSIKQAKEFFEAKGLNVLIATTKSHGIEKSGKPACDRFRVVIPLKYKFTGNKADFSRMMDNLYKEWGVPVDIATKNISRLWFGNPKQEHLYTDGKQPLDFYKFDFEAEKKKAAYTTDAPVNETSLRGIVNWYMERDWGGRNNTLIRICKFLKNDKNMESEKIKSIILRVNTMFPEPVEEQELAKTIFRGL